MPRETHEPRRGRQHRRHRCAHSEQHQNGGKRAADERAKRAKEREIIEERCSSGSRSGAIDGTVEVIVPPRSSCSAMPRILSPFWSLGNHFLTVTVLPRRDAEVPAYCGVRAYRPSSQTTSRKGALGRPIAARADDLGVFVSESVLFDGLIELTHRGAVSGVRA